MKHNKRVISELSACIIMNLKHQNGESKDNPDSEEISNLLLEYNAAKYESFLQRFPSKTRIHIRSLPLLFHVNQNLLPGYVNSNVPYSVFGYIPDIEAIDQARSFNSRFNYDNNTPASDHSIEAIYIQDNLKSGKVILWIIHNEILDNQQIELLTEKANKICRWFESEKLKMECHVVTPCNMPIAYWGSKYNSIHPDKSIFLDDFYSEGILIAGKSPAWWLIPPDKEDQYEELIDNIKKKETDKFQNIIDFGSIANARPQDYLASAMINLINIKYCPEETWLNILGLCHKLTATPSLDCTSLRIKKQIYSGATESTQYHEVYCDTINNIINIIYGREKTIVITKILKLIAFQHTNNKFSLNIYRNLLSGRYDNETQYIHNNKFAYEFVPATEIIFSLIRQAFSWFIEKIDNFDNSLMAPDNALKTITLNLIRQIDTKDEYIPVTNIYPVRTTIQYDVCLQHSIENNNWTLVVAAGNDRNSIELRHGNSPIELTAWAVLNRIIDEKTRISVNCPLLSVKQTHIADIISILSKHLPEILTTDISLETYTRVESPVKDILIIHESGTSLSKTINDIHIYRFQITNYGEVIYDEYDGFDGLLSYACDSLTSDIAYSKKPHIVSMHGTRSGLSNKLTTEARYLYKNISRFAFEGKHDYTHFIDVANDHYYAIIKYDNKLSYHNRITTIYPEDSLKYTNRSVLMNFSEEVQNNYLLNYLYRNNIYGYLQVFYRIYENISHIYILDENGVLTRFSQPFHDRQSFLNQWLMFIYNTRNHIRSITKQDTFLPNIEICELTFKNNDQLIKTHLNSSMLPRDKRYFDLKIVINGEKGNQSIALKCEDMEFNSEEYGQDIFDELKKYLSRNFMSGSNNPIYVTDVETHISMFNISDNSELRVRDYIKYKINIEKRLNTIINWQ